MQLAFFYHTLYIVILNLGSNILFHILKYDFKIKEISSDE
jgi:hypothetical protein